MAFSEIYLWISPFSSFFLLTVIPSKFVFLIHFLIRRTSSYVRLLSLSYVNPSAMVAFSVSAITHATSNAYAESFLSLVSLFNLTISLQKLSAVCKIIGNENRFVRSDGRSANRSLIFNHYLYTVKITSGRKNYIIMTKNPNPNIILTCIIMPLKKNPGFHECCV